MLPSDKGLKIPPDKGCLLISIFDRNNQILPFPSYIKPIEIKLDNTQIYLGSGGHI